MISPELLRQLRPCSGRSVISIDETPSLSPGGLHIPDSARGVKVRDKAYSGTVLAMTPRRTKQGFPGKELFEVGDRVWVMLLLEDLGKEVIVTMNTRVYAVLGAGALSL